MSNKLKGFMAKYKRAFEQPIVRNFLEYEENMSLLNEVLVKPNEEKKRILDERFKEFYKQAKLVKYISNLMYFYSIDYDKRVRKNNERFILNVDNSHSNVLEKLTDVQSTDMQSIEDFIEQIDDRSLYLAIKNLTHKQKLILELIYLRDFTNKEVADLFKGSPQNISQIHKRTLKKIKKEIVEGRK